MSIVSFQKKTEIYLKSRSGMGSIMTVLGAAIAAALIVFPLARWQMSLTQNIATTTQELRDMNTEFEIRAALEDRWRQINDMTLSEFSVAPNKWSKEAATKYGKYLVWEKYGALGTYNPSTGQCNAGTKPGEDDKGCRVATLQATDAAGTKVYSSVTAIKVSSAKKIIRNDQKVTLWSTTYRSTSPVNHPVTAPSDGMVVIWTCFHCNGLQFNIYVNGTNVVHQNVSQCDTLAPFMVNKGDVITITTGAGVSSGYMDMQVFLIPTG